MKRLFTFLFVVILFNSNEIFACDQCGCSMAGSYNNVTSYANNNFLILRSSFNSFYTYPESSDKIISHFNSFDLIGGYNVTRNLHLTGYIPYKINSYQGSEINYSKKGIGDAGLIANYILLTNRDSLMKKSFYTFSLKGGIELPTGKFNKTFRTDELPASLSLGSGTIDFMGGTRFIYKKKNTTLLGDYTFKYNFENSSYYQFGNQHTLTVIAAQKFMKSQYVITPYSGISGEVLSADKFHELVQHGTAGENVFIDLGCEFGFKDFIVGASADIPLYSDFSGESSSNPRYGVRVAYLFE